MEQVANVVDRDCTFQDSPKTLDDPRRQLRQVGNGLLADALSLTPSLTQEDGGLASPVGD